MGHACATETSALLEYFLTFCTRCSESIANSCRGLMSISFMSPILLAIHKWLPCRQRYKNLVTNTSSQDKKVNYIKDTGVKSFSTHVIYTDYTNQAHIQHHNYPWFFTNTSHFPPSSTFYFSSVTMTPLPFSGLQRGRCRDTS